MNKDRLLNKKFERLNTLKNQLVSRSKETNEEVIEDIKDTVDDIELMLEDLLCIREEEIPQQIKGYKIGE